MQYDPSRRALYHPETDDPVADFSVAWPVDAICAELSRLAYYRFEANDRPRLENALAQAGFARTGIFVGTDKDAQGFGTIGPDRVAYVAFRGTQPDSLRDVFYVNADFKLVPRPGGGRVHQGFLAAFATVRRQIDDWLAAVGPARLVVTGHSLGAALATVMAAERPGAELVTFGSPRVGDSAFAALFAGRAVRRYVDCTDVVDGVPPGILSYAHLHGMRYIDRFGAVRPTPPGAEEIARDRRSANLIYALKCAWQVWRNAAMRGFADHAPINYVSALLGRRTGP
jgi:pimeloyl-ACP methyl ester carboxylesterase